MNPLSDAALCRSTPAYHTAVSTAKPEQHSFCSAQIIASFGVKLAYGVKIAGNHCKQKARNFSVYQEVSGFVLLKLEIYCLIGFIVGSWCRYFSPCICQAPSFINMEWSTGRRQKKKAVVQQFFSYAWLENGGFEQIKAAVLLSLKGKTTTTR